MADEEPDLELLKSIGRANAERQEYVLGGRPFAPEPEPPPVYGRTRRCQRCNRLFEEKRARTVEEIERLHATLMISGSARLAEMVFCDSCYEIITESPMRQNNFSSYDIGGSNIQPPNFLLQQKYGKR